MRYTNQRGERMAVVPRPLVHDEGQAGGSCCRRLPPDPRRPRMPMPSTRARRAGADRDRQPRRTAARCNCSACSWTLQHAYDQRAPLPDRRSTPRACTRTTCARSTIWRSFRSRPSRTCATTTRSACSPCRASRSCASMPRQRHHRQADRGRLHAERHRHLGRSGGALDPRRRRARRRHRPCGLRLRPVHRRPRRALRRRAAGLHRDPDVAAGRPRSRSSSSRTSSPTSSWSRRPTCR